MSSPFKALVIRNKTSAQEFALEDVPSYSNGQARFRLSTRGGLQPPQPGDEITIYESLVGSLVSHYIGVVSVSDFEIGNEVCNIVLWVA